MRGRIMPPKKFKKGTVAGKTPYGSLNSGHRMAIFPAMSTHSVAEAKNRLSELIDRALAGEGVTITRHGHPVVELKPVTRAPGTVTAEDLDWIAGRRVGRSGPEDAGAFVSRMRDEEER